MIPEWLSQWLGIGLVYAGVLFALLGSIGLNRLPDFFTRAHAATKPDTLGVILLMIGLVIFNGVNLNSAKLLLIVLVLAIANPSAAHALGRSAVRKGLQPWMKTSVAGAPRPHDQREESQP